MKVLHTVGHTITKHSPLILTTVGVAGLGATAYFSYKAAPKVEELTNELESARLKEQRINDLRALLEVGEINGERMNDETYDGYKMDLEIAEEEFNPIRRVDYAKRLAGAVALPVLTGLASVTCIGLSYYIQNNRIVNLAAAFATATAEREYYRSKIKEEFGEDKLTEFDTPTVTEEMKVDGKKKKVKKAKDVPSLHGEWFEKSTEWVRDDHDYNMAFINSVNESLQLRLFQRGHLLMNEVLDALGLERTRAGAMVGWSTGTGFGLYPEVTQVVDDNGMFEPRIYIKWTKPKYIYDDVDFEGRYGI